ncbi:MAG: ATP-dependent 6-phosphofructokinase [Treponema sp.]|jgi:6-phosphofructokinase 1|nr:ATP-dependent 6-phosphofructokinase [Treponema sp.]
MKIGLLTSGGDCQGLNAALRGIAKTLFICMPDIELYGIPDGYGGLIEGNWRKMESAEFSGILRQGGTILGTSRQPFKKMRELNSEGTDKLSMMLENYEKGCFDALVILGGNGTHKTAHLLSQNSINVITLPKTIDNDVYGTDVTFGFNSAVDKATSVIDAIHTTAASHGRVFVIELMGNKVGWITLCAGIAGGADVILIPEMPYDVETVITAIEARNRNIGKFSIIAIAEGALTKEEAALPKNERKNGDSTSGSRLAKTLSERLEQEVRAVIPGHFQRGGEPTPTDRLLCSRFGAKAGELICKRKFGYMVALRDNDIVAVPLDEVAGKSKSVPLDAEMLHQAKLLGISLGN